MKRPKIFDLEAIENTLFENDCIIVSEKDGDLVISSKKENRSIKAGPEDWFDYGLHVFTPESAQKAVDIMFDYDKILESPNQSGNDDFNPTLFKVFHKESGFFSRKGNKELDPKKNKDGEWDKVSKGWHYSEGGSWSKQNHAILHIRNIFRFIVRPDLYKSGEEYYQKRNEIISRYGILAMDNQGISKKYDAIDLIPKTENHRNWVDFAKWDELQKEEERLSKQKLRDQQKKLKELKMRS